MGEVDFVVTLDKINLRLRALVMQDLQADCFGGTTFHVDNGIETNIVNGSVKLHRKYVVKQYNSCKDIPAYPPSTQMANVSSICPMSSSPTPEDKFYPSAVRFNAVSLPVTKLVLPSDYLPIPIRTDAQVSHVSITPSFPSAIDN